MGTELKQITVFRSADDSAEQDAGAIREVLQKAGLDPELLTHSEPGVSAWEVEVRVPASQEAQARQAILDAEDAPPEPVDASHDLDLVTIYEGVGTAAEVEAVSIRSLLDANGIASVMMSAAQYPNFPWVVRVSRAMQERAESIIAEARQAGPEGAEEAEKASERP